MKLFLYNYIRSMRLYYCFVTGTTVLLGMTLANDIAQKSGQGRPTAMHQVLLLLVGFFAWGVNQVFSDYLDRKEDAINAPHRPMVTGALPPRPALLLSAMLILAFAIASAFVSIWTLPVLACGAALNCAYSLLKKVPILNCLVYACAISCCALFGYIGCMKAFPDASLLLLLVTLLVVIHFLMCHNSYYKDVPGDRATGIRTLQTLCHRHVSITVSLVFFASFFIYGVISLLHCLDGTSSSLINFLIHLLLQILLASLHIKSILAEKHHEATRLNCELCVSMLYTLILQIEHSLLITEILSLLMIEALFIWYRDEKE
ncbi:MAG: UbiA family prenyltransferase [Victivallales bacterium]|nr:UbiA family prenyltransferase [Victivallales bacterium]